MTNRLQKRPISRSPSSQNTIPGSPQKRFFNKAQFLWLTQHDEIEAPVVALFRKSFRINGTAKSIKGFCFADSRYRLFVNGRGVQKGPAPFDPCYPEMDPLDIPAELLKKGENWFACEVLFYGGSANGDGQYLPSLPCLILEADIQMESGQAISIATDDTWECRASDAWQLTRRNGHVFVHETFDAAKCDERWKTGRDADEWYRSYAYSYDPNTPIGTHKMQWAIAEIERETGSWIIHGHMLGRSIPLLHEAIAVPDRITGDFDLKWRQDMDRYFKFLAPDCYTLTKVGRDSLVSTSLRGRTGQSPHHTPNTSTLTPLRLSLKKRASRCLNIVFDREVCGYPCFEIESNTACQVDLIFSEDVPGNTLSMDRWRNHLRVFLRKGVTTFEALTYEAVKTMQVILTSQDAVTNVIIKKLFIKERLYPLNQPHLKTHDPHLDRLISAAINTSRITIQDVVMDNVYRERGPYGTMGMEIGTLCAFGAEELMFRSLINVSRSLTKYGFFLCQWPGVANALGEFARVKGGYNLIDGPVDYPRTLWNAYYHTGNIKILEETFTNVKTFVKWLIGHAEKECWLRWDFDPGQVIWLEHLGKWGPLRIKECAFNMYVYNLFHSVFPAIARTLGDREFSDVTLQIAEGIKKKLFREFWSDELGLFVNNLPWVSRDGHYHIHELTFAISIMFGIVDEKNRGNTVDALANRCFRMPHVDDVYTVLVINGKKRKLPMGIFHPAFFFRLEALGLANRPDIILKDLREVWAQMESVKQNLTIAESWGMRGIGGSYGRNAGAWAQCNTVPLHMLFRHIIGLRPLEPGWRTFAVEPNLVDLDTVEATCYTPRGKIEILLHKNKVEIDYPKTMTWIKKTTSKGGTQK